MRLHEIHERLGAIDAEMRTLYDGAETAGDDLTGEKLEKWAALKAERDDLKVKEERARTRDEIDRRAEGRPLEQRGDAEGESAFGLVREQRMSQFIATQSGQPENRSLSVGRVAAAVLRGGDWREAEAERRAMGTTVGATGGFMVPDLISANLIDLMRNAAVLIQAGALTIPMAGPNLRLVRVLADPTAQWRAEGAEIAESDGTFGALNLQAYSLAALVRVNNELLDDVPTFAATLDNQLASALALKLDYAGLYGTGAGLPLGLRNTDGVAEQSMGTNGLAQPDYDKLLDLIQAVQEANGAPDTLIHSPRTRTKLAKIKTGISGDLTKLAPPPDYVALRKLVSNQVSITETQGNASTASTTFIGGFQNMALAIRQSIQIEIARQGDGFASNQSLVRAILRADVAVYRPNQFGRLIGIL